MISNSAKIAILLTTFNSAKFLSEQIDSLYNQSMMDWTLYIRDDCSDDNTLDIIRSYINKYDNIVLLCDTIKKRGARDSFMWLLESIDSEYYMFCDHDDVWLPNKIKLSFSSILSVESDNQDKPVIVNTDLYVVNENLEIISDSFWKYSRLNPRLLTNVNYLSVNYFVTGCTMLFNRRVKDIAFPIVEDFIMHDAWISMVVLTKGGVIYPIYEPTIYYRQHFSNVFGAKKMNLDFQYYFSKLRSAISLVSKYRRECRIVNKVYSFCFARFILYKILYIFRR